MFTDDIIKNCISEYISDGAKSFIIYPYGANGIRTNDILQRFFFVKSEKFVDNIKADKDSSFMKVEELKNEYKVGEYVILTIENEETNQKMLIELKQIVPEKYIMNLLEYKKKNISLVWEKNKYNLSLNNILPGYKGTPLKCKQDDKIRIRIVHGHYPTWNVIKTICDAIMADDLFDLKLIIGWDKDPRCVEQAKKYGISFDFWDEYDAKYDSPDILVVTQPYDDVTQLANINEYVKLVVVTSVLLILNTGKISWFWGVQRKGFSRFRPDYYLCDSMLYNSIKDSEHFPVDIVEMGNAKYDGIYLACKQKPFPKEWEKIKGKKILLWTTDHGFMPDRVFGVTFDLYAKAIFRYSIEHPEIGLVFRPHPVLLQELVREGYWSGRDIEEIKKWCKESANIIFDDSETYDNAYSVADGIIADAICGITVSALPTLKPICVTYRTKDDEPFHPELVENYYSAHDSDELISFMDMISKGEDPMFSMRKAAAGKYVKHFDGKNGWRIKEFIKQKYFEKMKEENK